MRDNQDINAIFDRIANRNATDGDIQTLRQSIVASVAIGGNADGSKIVTGDDNILGDNNTVQVGKYNINIAEGSNIKVGDTIYQGTDAETIRSMLLEVLTDKIVIDSTFARLFGKSESSGVDWDWAMKLLKQKQLPEIRKRLTDTLGRDRILMDVSIEEQQNWVNRSPLAADRTLQINGEDCGTLDANKMLIETFGRDDIEGKLLILGAPGAGKTTALLSLAEQLVYGAISQPKTVIPVIFELSTWQNDNQSIQAWLIEQLYDLHGGNRKSKLYEQWLERQVLLPLLDGLDELGLERQKKCTEKLNEFAEHYPQLVVCCRVKEFETADIKLRNLRGAVCLQSLSDSQIQHYLDSLNRPELWETIQTTPSLQAMLEPTTEGDPGLLRVPLFVKLVADVYDPQQPISSKADLLDKYIDRQLSFDKREIDHRKELNDYKWAYKTVKLELDWKKTRSNLSWLARNLQANNHVEFLIEHLQPSSINSVKLHHRYNLIFGMSLGSMFWLLDTSSYMFINGWIDKHINWLENKFILQSTGCLIYALIYGLIYVFIGESKNRRMIFPIVSLFAGLTFEIIATTVYDSESYNIYNSLPTELYNVLYFGLSIGITTGMIGGLIQIEPIEAFQFSILNIMNREVFGRLIVGITFGLIIGIITGIIIGIMTDRLWPIPILPFVLFGSILGSIGGLIYGLTHGLIHGLKRELKVRSISNQGIWKSLLSQTETTMIIFLFVILPFLPFYFGQNWQHSLLVTSALFALILGFAVGGGKACLQHLSLRIVLWQSGLPWNFARFLNYCVERRLLLRVGGSYRFLHRELLDHFAQSSR